MTARTATAPRLGSLDRGATRIAAGAGVVCLEILLAYLVSEGLVSGEFLLAGALLAATVISILLAPRTALLVLAGGWGIAHALLGDIHLFSLGSIDLTVSRALGIVLVLSLGGLLVISRRTPDTPPLPTELRALVLLLVMYVVIAVPISPHRTDALSDLIRIGSGVLVGVVAYRVFDSRQRVLTLAKVVTICGVVVALLTILQFLLLRVSPALASSLFGASFYERSFDPNDLGSSAVRVSGPLGGSQETAGFLLIAIGFALLRYTVLRETVRRGPLVFTTVVLALGLIITLTRAATVALVILLVVWAAQRQTASLNATALRLRLISLVTIVVVVAVPILGAQTLASRLSDANPATSGQNFAQGRGEIWAGEIQELRTANPVQLVLGHGGHASYLPVLTPTGFDNFSPHNVFFWSLVELGLVGTVLYCIFLFGSMRSYARAARRHRFRFVGQVGAVALALSIAYLAQDLLTLSVASPGHRWYFMLFAGATLRVVVSAAQPDQRDRFS